MTAKVLIPVVGLLIVIFTAVAAVVLIARGDQSSIAMPPPTYVDVTTSSGVEHTYDGDWTFYVGGGVASFDCNDDELPDLYFAGGANQSQLFVNASEVGERLAFTDATTDATALDSVTGAYPVDVDSDGIVDLVVLRNGPNMMLRGLGSCEFEPANDRWGIDPGDAWTTAFSATWEGDAGWPTLAFGNYVQLDEDGLQNGDCYDNVLMRPNGSGYGDPIALSPGWCSLSMLFSDWSRTGQRDLRVSNDRHYYRDGEEQLWRLARDVEPSLYTESDGWNNLQIWGMGIASQDTTGDAYPEIFLTSQADNKLQTLAEDSSSPNYKDIAIRSGVTAHRPFVGGDVMPSTAWHPEFEDVNNDGYMDLYISKGNVDSDPGFAAADPNNLFIGQIDGTFVEGAESAGIVTFSKSRGAVLVDLNLDGWLDLVEVNREENVRLWRNEGAGTRTSGAEGNWIGITLAQDGGNPDAVGAWIEVKRGDHVIRREVTVGGGHVSGEHGPMHFGLGPSRSAEIRVTWPDGSATEWMPVDADGFVTVTRGESSPKRWVP